MCRKGAAVWVISIELLEGIARLFSGNPCASGIPSKALHESKVYLFIGLVVIRIKMELSQSGLQQSNRLVIISFKSQLSDLDLKRSLIRSLLVYCGQKASGLLQVTLALGNGSL